MFCRYHDVGILSLFGKHGRQGVKLIKYFNLYMRLKNAIFSNIVTRLPQLYLQRFFLLSFFVMTYVKVVNSYQHNNDG